MRSLRGSLQNEMVWEREREAHIESEDGLVVLHGTPATEAVAAGALGSVLAGLLGAVVDATTQAKSRIEGAIEDDDCSVLVAIAGVDVERSLLLLLGQLRPVDRNLLLL